MEVSSRLYYKPFLSISEAETKNDLDLVKMEKEESPFKILNDEEAEWLNGELDKYGEDENELLENGFEVIETEDCEGDDELKVKDGDYNLAKDWGVNADNLSKYDVKAKDGSGVWLVRYQYALSKKLKNQGEPDLIDTSRNFCIHQIDSAENGNRVFKREVLENLNNAESGSYNVFWYKGSYNCRHVWQ